MGVLSSRWPGLSPHLKMSIFPVEMMTPGDSRSFAAVAGGDEVVFPIAPGGEMRQTQNWTSPFENMTPDASVATMSAMLQVGGFGPVLQALEKNPLIPNVVKDQLQKLRGEATGLIGASSVTRFNSTQIFSGSPPLQMSVTALFRALEDPAAEVAAPVNRLWEWHLPASLSGDLALQKLIEGGSGPVAALYPSRAPQVVGVRYRGMVIMPMVIESIGQPLDSPIDVNGQVISTQIPLQINSYCAFDANDWRSARR